MKKPITLVKNAAGTYVATKLSERFVRRTRKKFGGSLVKLAIGGVALWAGLTITGAVFGAAIGAIWWVLTLPLYHPFITTTVGVGAWLYFRGKKLLK